MLKFLYTTRGCLTHAERFLNPNIGVVNRPTLKYNDKIDGGRRCQNDCRPLAMSGGPHAMKHLLIKPHPINGGYIIPLFLLWRLKYLLI